MQLHADKCVSSPVRVPSFLSSRLGSSGSCSGDSDIRWGSGEQRYVPNIDSDRPGFWTDPFHRCCNCSKKEGWDNYDEKACSYCKNHPSLPWDAVGEKKAVEAAEWRRDSVQLVTTVGMEVAKKTCGRLRSGCHD